jgi:anti-sigma factor RsiW
MVQSKTSANLNACAHETDELLEAYVMGALFSPVSSRLEEHILWCRACQIRLEETAAYVEAIRAALGRVKT